MYLELYSQVYILLADFYIHDVVNDSDCHPDNAERKCLLVEMNPYIEYDNQSDQRKHQMSTLAEVLALHPDGVFFSNGPGDPDTAVSEIYRVARKACRMVSKSMFPQRRRSRMSS